MNVEQVVDRVAAGDAAASLAFDRVRVAAGDAIAGVERGAAMQPGLSKLRYGTETATDAAAWWMVRNAASDALGSVERGTS